MNNEFNDIQEFGNRKRDRNGRIVGSGIGGWNRQKLKLVIGVVLIIVVVLIIALISTQCSTNNNTDEKETNKQEETTLKSEQNTEETKEQPQLVALASDNEVYGLVMSYIDAAYVKCDETLLKEVVDSFENVNVEINSIRQRYIESYNDVKVYMLDGKENINVIFIAYNAKLYNYDTMLPSGETLKVKKCEDGKYKIHNIEVGEQFETHMTNKAQVEELSVIQEKIQSEYNAVIEGNSEIKSIIDILNGIKIE